MPRICIKPAEGRQVRSPDHNHTFLPAYGEEVTDSTYWQRRFLDQDIEATTLEAIQAGREAEQAAAAKAAEDQAAAETALSAPATEPAPPASSKRKSTANEEV